MRIYDRSLGHYTDTIESVNYGKIKRKPDEARINVVPVAYGQCPIKAVPLRTTSIIVESEADINPNPLLALNADGWTYTQTQGSSSGQRTALPGALTYRSDVGAYGFRLSSTDTGSKGMLRYTVPALEAETEYVFSILMASCNLACEVPLLINLYDPQPKISMGYGYSSTEVLGQAKKTGFTYVPWMYNKWILWTQYQIKAVFPLGSTSRSFLIEMDYGIRPPGLLWDYTTYPPEVWFGNARVGRSTSDDSDLITVLAGLCEGETDNLVDISIEGKTWDVISGSKASTFYRGNLTQTPFYTFSMQSQAYRGLSYAAIVLDGENDNGISTSSEVTVTGKWTRCFQIGSTSAKSWTDNPAQILWHFYLTRKAAPAGELDENAFQALYTYCATRWSFNYVFDQSTSVEEMEKVICSSFFGRVIRSQGKYKPVWAFSKSPVYSFNLTNIKDITPDRSTRSAQNVVRVKYMDGDHDYIKDSIEKIDPVSIALMGESLLEDACYWITNRDEASRRCAYLYDDARYNSMEIKITSTSLDASLLEPYDRVSVTHPYMGLEDASFQVSEITQDLSGNTEIRLAGYNSAVFHDQAVPDEPVNPQYLDNPFEPPPAPADLQVLEGYRIGPDSTWYIELNISWQHPARYTLPKTYLIWIKHSSQSVFTLAGSTTLTTHTHTVTESGYYDIVIQTENSAGYRTDWNRCAYAGLTALGKLAPPSAVTGFSCQATEEGNLLLKWNPIPDPDVLEYEVRTDIDWGNTAGLVAKVRGLECQYIKPQVPSGQGNAQFIFYIKAIDTSDIYSEDHASVSMIVNRPPQVGSLRKEVVDNNILLRWDASQTTFPLSEYIIKRGASWAAATEIARVSGTFAPVYEAMAGTYTYWVASVDMAGNISEPVSISALISQPPDFVIIGTFNAQPSWGGTKTNAIADQGVLYIPVKSAETVNDRAGLYSTPQAQIDAGYTYVLQPANATGSYAQTYDLGASLDSGKVTLDTSVAHIVAGTALSCEIEFSANGSTWTSPISGWEAMGFAFRYIRVTLSAAGNGYQHCYLTRLDGRVDVRSKSDSGTGYANSGDTGGTQVNFNKAFSDISSITVTPSGTSARFAVYDFVDAPNPTGFKVLLFNTSGTRVSGDFSWVATGY